MQPLPKTQMPGQRQLSGSILRDNSRWQRQQRIIAGNGVTLSRTAEGIRITGTSQAQQYFSAAKSSITPFTVRWYDYGNDGGEWQIYLPYGCATLNSKSSTHNYTYVPKNTSAKDENGKAIFGWYRIETPDDSDAQVGESDGMKVKQWTVYMLRKPYPRMMLSTSSTAFDTVAEALAVATINYTEYKDGESTEKYRSTGKLVTAAQSFSYDDMQEFSIVYRCSGNASDPSAEFKAYVTNTSYLLSREQVEAESSEFDVTGWNAVYLIFNHANYKYSIGISDKPKTSDLNKTCVQIYKLKDDVVTSDWRDSLDKLAFIN